MRPHAHLLLFGKDPTLALGTGIPFGLNARQHSWWHFAEGKEFINAVLANNAISFACGNSGTQMGGFFRKELQSTADLNGLKFRIGGLGGMVLAKLGVVPQQIAGGDVYRPWSAALDAAEFVGPYDDEKLGLSKVAVLLRTRLVGGRRHAPPHRQPRQVE